MKEFTKTACASERFFHCNQVGSVHHESNVAGGAVQKHYQDSFGNTVAAWNTGMWGGIRNGFHHNTKEFDEDAELVYMHQRWYLPEVGVFLSRAPVVQWVEAPYGFTNQLPTMRVDPNGEFWHIVVGGIVGGLIDAAIDMATCGFDPSRTGREFMKGAAAGAIGAAMPIGWIGKAGRIVNKALRHKKGGEAVKYIADGVNDLPSPIRKIIAGNRNKPTPWQRDQNFVGSGGPGDRGNVSTGVVLLVIGTPAGVAGGVIGGGVGAGIDAAASGSGGCN